MIIDPPERMPPSWRSLHALSRPNAQVGLFTLFVLLAVWGVIVFEVVVSRDEALQSARLRNETLARTLDAHTKATLEAADLLLDRGADKVLDDGMPSFEQRGHFIRDLLRSADRVARVAGVGVFSADGLLRAAITRDAGGDFVPVGSEMDLIDRDYVRAIFSVPGEELFVGEAIQSRVDGVWVLPVSRPIRDMAGGLVGGVAALIDISTFVSLFEAVRPEGASQVGLVRASDSVLLAGAPLVMSGLGKAIQAPGWPLPNDGAPMTEVVAAPKGPDLLRSWIAVGRSDLAVIVGADMDRILASWRGWRNSLVMIGLGISLAVLVMAFSLLRVWRRRMVSETALARSRQALMHSMERFERSVAGATSALWEIDLVNGGGYFAPQWELMLGWRDIQNPQKHWRDHLHPDDRDRVLAELDRHLTLREPFDTEYRLRAADGTWRWVRARGQAAWDGGGRPVVMSGMAHDITDLRLSEERLRLALEATDEGLWDWTVGTGRLFMAARWKTQLGYDPDHPFADHWRTFLRLARPEDRGRVIGWARDMLEGRSDRQVAEFRMRRADGGWAWVRASAKITERDAAGHPQRVVGTLKDITLRREEKAQLQLAKEQAELASRAKSEFLANMSHELRTPLNGISGFSESLESRIFGDLNAKQLEYVRDIRVSADHLTALIGDILDMAKIESGRDDLREEAVDVAATIVGKLHMVRQRAAEKSIVLREDLEPLPPYRLDARKFGQMVLNLLANAVKFTPEGGVVTVRAASGADGALDVAVIDTGIGIAPKDIARVVEPFHQVDSRLSRQYQGTGLGLPLVKAMAELHGGSLDLCSALGKGTVVTLRLPGSRRLPMAAREDVEAGGVGDRS